MPIIYSLVARGTVVLAEYAATTGNFVMITRRILERIPPSDGKMSYEYDSYMFHYIMEDGIIYLCIAEQGFPRRTAFAFLQDMKQRFEAAYSERMRTALAYAMNEDFTRVMRQQTEHYSSGATDSLGRVKGEIDEVKGVMVSNIEKVIDRGDKIDLLVGKTESLNQQSLQFKKRSGTLKNEMWWKNFKLNLMIFGIVFAVVLIILMSVCGVDFKKC